MPVYIPTQEELDLVHRAVVWYRTNDVDPLEWIDRIARGERPEHINWRQIAPGLLEHPRSLALAIALAIMRPVWNAAAARQEFCRIREPLLAAWAARPHNAGQKLRKTLDAAVAFGALQSPGWPLARHVVFNHVLDACMMSAAYLKGPPEGTGLIPALSECWGQPFDDEVPVHATMILQWLTVPVLSLTFEPEWYLLFANRASGCLVAPGFTEVLPGSRRSFLLKRGRAQLAARNTDVFAEPVPAGQRLILRSFDEGESEVHLARLVVRGRATYLDGKKLKLGPMNEPWGSLSFETRSDLELWTCPCGGWSCDDRHRLSSWHPGRGPANATLRTFLLTAVKGPGAVIKFGTFLSGMYYALLCSGQIPTFGQAGVAGVAHA
jgi:hypothetical protein